jgi:hypothetical protein
MEFLEGGHHRAALALSPGTYSQEAAEKPAFSKKAGFFYMDGLDAGAQRYLRKAGHPGDRGEFEDKGAI